MGYICHPMLKLLSKTTFVFLFISSSLFGQNWCATHEMSELSLQQNPHLRQAVDELEALTQEQQFQSSGERASKIVPVVVHIIHNYGIENISREQVLDAIQILNEDFQLLNSDQSQIIPQFAGIKGNPSFEFRLARIDPNGNCTDGINRIVSPLTFTAGDNVKLLPGASWPRNRYFNIWVVDNLSNGAGGYAYLPGSSPSATVDGVIVRHRQFGSIGTSSGANFAARTLTHEAGHWFNLRHPWGPTNTPGLSTNCSVDDGVADTPNTIGVANQSCNLSQTSCNSLDNVQNYMDYSSCAIMFTQGQVNRMTTAINSNTASRSNLWKTENLIATGTNVINPNLTCKPKADFKISSETACAGSTVTLTDLSFNAVVDSTWTWNWSFPGGTPATSNAQNPTVSYAEPGTYNITLTVSNAGGSDSKTKNSIITILPSTGVHLAPFFEGFESGNFPQGEIPNSNWTINTQQGNSFTRVPGVSASGFASIKYNSTGGGGDVIELISPGFNLTPLTADFNMKFKIAYRPANTGSRDILKVFVSQNCGQTWSPRYSKSGNAIATVSGTGGGFEPQSISDWREENVNLTSFATATNLLVKFEFTDSTGASLYIDDINLGNSPLSMNDFTLNYSDWSIYPNPTDDYQITNHFSLLKKERVSIELIDVIGRVAKFESFGTLAPGDYNQNLDLSGLSKGVYTLRLMAGNESFTKRLMIK